MVGEKPVWGRVTLENSSSVATSSTSPLPFVIGVAFGALVTALVKDLITPLIAAFVIIAAVIYYFSSYR